MVSNFIYMTIEITTDEFVQIRKALGKCPYDEVQALIIKLAEQAQKQLQPQEQQEAK